MHNRKYIQLLLLMLMSAFPLALKAQSPSENNTTLLVIENEYDSDPEYPGGEQALYTDILMAGISYPMAALEQHIQGKVVVSFVVEKDGSVSNIKIERDDIGYGAADDVIAAVQTLKTFKPGIKDGKPMRAMFSIPISYTIRETEHKNFWQRLFGTKSKK